MSPNILLTGLPRSGTTLTCSLLGDLPDTVALHEPMDVRHFPQFAQREDIATHIAEFVEDNRRSLLRDGRARSKQVGGKIPTNPFSDRRSLFGHRKERTTWGTIQITKELSDTFTLAVKHPSAFSALLDVLAGRFEVFATIRNPLAVLASWNSVDVPVSDGHAPAAEELDSELQTQLACIPERINRQLHLLGWFLDRYTEHLAPDHILRYEDVIDSGGRALEVITPRAAQMNAGLENRNSNRVYDRSTMRELGAALLALDDDASVWRYYSRSEIERLIPGE